MIRVTISFQIEHVTIKDIKRISMLSADREFHDFDTLELRRHRISGTSINFELIFQHSEYFY